MAFGALLSSGSNTNLSIPASFSPSAAVTVVIGNLIIVWVVEQTAITVTGVTDNLLNSYTPLNAGTLGGSTGGRGFFSVATAGGACTPVAACTSSAHNGSIQVAVYDGPYAASPLDANPANSTNTTSPYTTPLTGTLAQASEIVTGFYASSSTTAFTLPSPGAVDVQTSVASASGAILSVVVAATTTMQFTVTQTSSGNAMQGIASFKQSVASDTLFAQSSM